MMVVTVSGDVWKRGAIERQVKEARQEGEDGRGGRSVTKPTTKEERGAMMTGKTTINKANALALPRGCGPKNVIFLNGPKIIS